MDIYKHEINMSDQPIQPTFTTSKARLTQYILNYWNMNR